MPRQELRMLCTLSKSFLAVSELISPVSMFTNGPRWWVNTTDTVLFSVAVLATVASSAESLELEVLGGERKK